MEEYNTDYKYKFKIIIDSINNQIEETVGLLKWIQ